MTVAIPLGLVVSAGAIVLYANAAAQQHLLDFGSFLGTTRHLWLGEPAYIDDAWTQRTIAGQPYSLLNMNPPAFHLWVLPVAALPAPIAYLVWMAVQLAGLVRAAFLSEETVPSRRTTEAWLGLIIALVLSSPFLAFVATGQLSGLLAWWAAEAWRAARRERWGAVGVWVGLLAGTKLFLLVLPVGLLVRGHYRAAATALATMVAYYALGLLCFGVAPLFDWIDALQHVSWAWVPLNGAISAPFVRLFETNPWYTGIDELARVPQIASIALGGGLLVATFATVRWRHHADRDLLLLLVAATLASPLGHVYYALMWLAPLLAWLSGTPKSLPVRVFLGLAAALAFVPLTLTQPVTGVWWTLTLGSAYTWSGVALVAALLVDAWRPTNASGVVPA